MVHVETKHWNLSVRINGPLLVLICIKSNYMGLGSCLYMISCVVHTSQYI